MDFDDLTNCAYAPAIWKIILYAIREELFVKRLCLSK